MTGTTLYHKCLAAAAWLPIAAAITPATPALAQDTPEAMLPNPGWEHGGVPWWFHVSDKPIETRPGAGEFGSFSGDITADATRSGRRGYAIRGPDAAPDAVATLQNDLTDLVPGRMYRVTYYVRGKGVGEGYLKVGPPDNQAAAPLPKGDFDWREVSIDWTAGPGQNRAPFAVDLIGPTGELALDDGGVRLSPLQDPSLGSPQPAPNAEVDGPTVRLPREKFDALEMVRGDFIQPQGQGTGGVLTMRLEGARQMQLGRTRVPLDAPDGPRRVGFTIPLAGLEDGRYTVKAELDGKPVAEASFERTDADKQIQADAKAVADEAQKLREQARQAGVAEDPYVEMGLALLERFTTRIETGGPDANQTRHWSRLQLAEMGEVLDDVRRRLVTLENGGDLHGVVKRPTNERMKIEGGRVMMPAAPVDGDASKGEPTTYFPIGYGHFIKVRRDIENHWTWGATIIQQGNGPGLFRRDGTLPEDGGDILNAMADAEEARLKIDYLVGSGIPGWVLTDKPREENPDLYVRNVGFIPQNLDHPLYREWSEKFYRAIIPIIKDSPAISSFCLSNEPAYAWSGRDSYSRPLYEQFLRDLHGDIDALNEAYGSDYADFSEIPVPIAEPIEPYNHRRPDTLPEKRLYHDYLMFHQGHFADWHRWLDSLANELAPEIPTHIKTVGPAMINPDVLHWGVDAERFADFTEIAGCDSHFWGHGPDSPYVFDWVNGYLSYDLLHSFRGQPVFNSENHVVRDNQQSRLERGHMYTAMFQSALHNGRMSAMWVWEAPIAGSLGGNISIRPASIYEHGEAAFDLSRLNQEVDALALTPPRVALVYSPTSIIWQPTYQPTTKQAWAGLTFLGEKVHFVTERQLAEGRVPESVEYIVLQRITHAKDETVAALAEFVEGGGHVLKVGDNVLTRDHYDRERELPAALADAETVTLSGDNNPQGHAAAADAFRPWLEQNGLDLVPLTTADGEPVYGVDFRRALADDGTELLAVANMMRQPKQVKLAGGGKATDLISGQTIDLANFELEPVRPMVLRIEGEPVSADAGGATNPEVYTGRPESFILNPVQNPSMGHGEWWWDWAGGEAASDEVKARGFDKKADRHEVHTALRSLRVEAKPGSQGVGRMRQIVKDLDLGRPYRVTFWTKGQNVPEGAAWVAGAGDDAARQPLPAGDWEWRETTLDFTAADGAADVPIGVDLPATTGDELAKIWVDDVIVDLVADERPTAEALPATRPGDAAPLVVAPNRPAEAKWGELALDGDSLAVRLQSAGNDKTRVTIDPTPAAARLVSREEAQAKQQAAEAPEVRNTPRAERRDLYFPEAYGPMPDDALAFTIDASGDEPTLAAPDGTKANVRRDGDAVVMELPLGMLNPDRVGVAVATITVGDAAPQLAMITSNDGPATALVTTAEQYDAGEQARATLLAYAPEAADAQATRLTLAPAGGEAREVAEVQLPAADAGAVRRADVRLPLQTEKSGSYELAASMGDVTAATMFERVDRRGDLRAEAERLAGRIADLTAAAESAGVREHHLVNMGLALADRFVNRVEMGGRDGNQDLYWSRLQLGEVAAVLDQTQNVLDKLRDGLELPGTVVRQTNTPLEIEGSDVVVEATPWGEPDAAPERTTSFVLGYGHFMKAHHDLPNFPYYGASIIQQGHGPPLFQPDGTFPEDLGGIRDAMSQAEAARMKIDYLTGNGVPPWVEATYDRGSDLFAPQVAFIEHNLDHPVVREWTSKFVATMLPILRQSPAIASICIVNEPAYVGSGRNPQSRPAYLEYLREKHGDIATLNELYGTDHASFDDVEPPSWRPPSGPIRENLQDNRRYYDWAMFNRQHFGAWHKWMHEQVKAAAPELPTHAKVMADTVFSRRRSYKGTDPELICEATDLAGVDAWHFRQNSMDDPYSVGAYAYQWQWPLIGYDLFHSFRGQPVFDSEKHIIRDFSRQPTLPGHLYAAHWLGALHNCRMSTMWVWEEPAGMGLQGNISLRPLGIYDAGRAMFDLSRLRDEVDALADAKEEVALLYSSTSLIWQPGHDVAVKRAWTAAANLGLPTTFVTDKQLKENRAADVKVILLPRASYLEDETVAALTKFVENGGKLIAIGEDALAHDEYGREREELPEAVADLPTIALTDGDPLADERRVTGELRGLLSDAELATVELVAVDTNEPAIGIDRRAVTTDDGRRLLAVTNLMNEPQTVRLADGGAGTDLISGESVELAELKLPSLAPMLIELK